jgi:hypothetical protein
MVEQGCGQADTIAAAAKSRPKANANTYSRAKAKGIAKVYTKLGQEEGTVSIKVACATTVAPSRLQAHIAHAADVDLRMRNLPIMACSAQGGSTTILLSLGVDRHLVPWITPNPDVCVACSVSDQDTICIASIGYFGGDQTRHSLHHLYVLYSSYSMHAPCALT